MKIHGYAIYNPKSDKWSRGGIRPSWSKTPKVWSDIGHLKSHLSHFIHKRFRARTIEFADTYRDCLVIDIVTGEAALDIYEYFYQKAQKIKEKKYYSDWEIIEK